MSRIFNIALSIIFCITTLFNSLGQSIPRCNCQNVEFELMPDTSIVQKNLVKLEINKSYFSWIDFLSLGADRDPESDPFLSNCFGCIESKIYDKKSLELFTGEVILTGDIERSVKNVPIARIQFKDGLKHGFEVYYNFDSKLNCYFPYFIAFMKNGMPYKKVYEFDYIGGKLRIKNEESYKDGVLFGITKTYDNYAFNGHQLIYEANIVKFPSRECCYIEHSEGNGLRTVYSKSNDVQFEGQRIQYYSGSGKIHWSELWKDGKIMYRKSYYEENSLNCKLKKEFPYEIVTYTYPSYDDFIEETIEYFPDCNSSIKELRSYRNYLLYGKYEKYYEPKLLMERGYYNDKGEKEGVWELYNEKGIIQERSTYEFGALNGIQELFDEKGILFRKLRYKDDEVIEILK